MSPFTTAHLARTQLERPRRYHGPWQAAQPLLQHVQHLRMAVGGELHQLWPAAPGGQLRQCPLRQVQAVGNGDQDQARPWQLQQGRAQVLRVWGDLT